MVFALGTLTIQVVKVVRGALFREVEASSLQTIPSIMFNTIFDYALKAQNITIRYKTSQEVQHGALHSN